MRALRATDTSLLSQPKQFISSRLTLSSFNINPNYIAAFLKLSRSKTGSSLLNPKPTRFFNTAFVQISHPNEFKSQENWGEKLAKTTQAKEGQMKGRCKGCQCQSCLCWPLLIVLLHYCILSFPFELCIYTTTHCFF